MLPQPVKVSVKRKTVKIGQPQYKVTKQRDGESGQVSLTFELRYPEIADGYQPRHRFMSAYEQRVEKPDRAFQYVLFAAEPYETIAFKIPNRKVDKTKPLLTNWDWDAHLFTLTLHFDQPEEGAAAAQNEGDGAGDGDGEDGQATAARVIVRADAADLD